MQQTIQPAAHGESNTKITEVIVKRKVPQNRLWNLSDLDNSMVTPPTHNWKTLWASFERMSQQLEELGIGDDAILREEQS